MAGLATESQNRLLSSALLEDLERRRPRLAHIMTRAIITEVRWDASTGVPPSAAAITRACEAGLDLFLATAREGRPATAEELRKVAQLGVLQARSSQSVEPVLGAYRIAARVAWQAILSAWRKHPDATPETMVVIANHVFTALDQVAAEVTHTFLLAREQHMQRGTRARTRLFHSLVSDTFDSELALQKQALGLSLPLAGSYVAMVMRLVNGKTESERGGEDLERLTGALDLPASAVAHANDTRTLALLWPADSADSRAKAKAVLQQIAEEASQDRSGAQLRAGLGGYHPGLHGISRSYLEAQQALEMGRRLRPNGGIHEYDDLVPYLVLSQHPLLMERYVRSSLGGLLNATGKGPLLQTLEAYLAAGSVKQAAAALQLHRHTVIYRLDKVRELLGVNLDDPAARAQLQLALDLRKLLDMESKTGT